MTRGDVARQSTTEPSAGGALTVVVDIEMNGVDPNNLVAGAARRVACNIAPGLVRLGVDWSIQPALAEAWEVLEAGQFAFAPSDEDIHKFAEEKAGELGYTLLGASELSVINAQLVYIRNSGDSQRQQNFDVFVAAVGHACENAPW